ncbi:MAG: hypothetical protein O2894_06360 [Planctomycetota bacterium]|nr:hypothetical protein [Planctomycetota bacterium]
MHRLIRPAPLALLCFLALVAAPHVARGQEPTVRGKPEETLARFKGAFARNDHQSEWDTLSPGFKRRISAQVGRTVDVGDYTAMREQHRNDPRMRELRQWLPSAGMTRIRYRGDGYADVNIRFGAAILVGQDVSARMVNHTLWELWIHGETQPYWGFTDDQTMRVYRTREGNNYVVETRDAKGKVTWRKQWKPEQVRSYQVSTRWYFDGFGTIEQEFMKELR